MVMLTVYGFLIKPTEVDLLKIYRNKIVEFFRIFDATKYVLRDSCRNSRFLVVFEFLISL